MHNWQKPCSSAISTHRKVYSAQMVHYTNVVLNAPCIDGKLAGNPREVGCRVTSATISSDSSIACGGLDLFGGSAFCCICLVQPTPSSVTNASDQYWGTFILSTGTNTL